MLNPKEKEAVEEGIRLAWVNWIAFFVALFIYALGGHFLERPKGSATVVEVFKYILSGLTVISLGAVYFLKKSMKEARWDFFPLSYLSKKVPDTNKIPPISTYLIANTLSFTLAESVGLYGVLLFFLSGEREILYPFLLVAAIALIPLRPKQEELEQLMMTFKHRP
jgi:hypothetical protein